MSRLLFWRAPSVKLHCFWALQATTLSDSPLHPGLLAEPRLSQFLPGYLVTAQLNLGTPIEGRQIGDFDEYSARGLLLRNGYDVRLDRGCPSRTRSCGLPLQDGAPRRRRQRPTRSPRAKTYFERTLRLFNLHGVEPVLVIMPYHPTALAAFRAAGWEVREEAFKAYLEGLRGRYRFHSLDYTDLASFHGDAGRLLRRRARHGRECARASSRRPSRTRRKPFAEVPRSGDGAGLSPMRSRGGVRRMSAALVPAQRLGRRRLERIPPGGPSVARAAPPGVAADSLRRPGAEQAGTLHEPVRSRPRSSGRAPRRRRPRRRRGCRRRWSRRAPRAGGGSAPTRGRTGRPASAGTRWR